MTRHLVLLAGLALVAGCVHAPLASSLTGSLHDDKAMKASLLRALPPGTPAAQARRFMEAEGFRCSLEKNSSFLEQTVRHAPIDFLYCVRSDPVGASGVIQRWGIAVVLDRDMVADVLVSWTAYNRQGPLPGGAPGLPPAIASLGK